LLVIGVILVFSSISFSASTRGTSIVVSKEGQKGASFFPPVDDITMYDFALTPLLLSDLYCWGNLTWEHVQPGETVNSKIWIINNGGSDLYWKITDWPSWGTWDFGSYFPVIPSGGTWIVFVNVTAPHQENTTFTGQVRLVNKDNASDFGVINASLTTCDTGGYTVAERMAGVIRNLQLEENKTSFTLLIGVGMRIIEYDDGGIVALVVPYIFMNICWSDDVLFEGVLRPHFIKGTVRYRVDYILQ
jgi:hypothetical protein